METEEPVDKPVEIPQHAPISEAERLAAQKKRSVWLALTLFGFVILIGLTSALQLKENIQRNANANASSPSMTSQDTQP